LNRAENWGAVAEKVGSVLSERFHEIRREVSSEEILEKFRESSTVALAGDDVSVSGVDIDINVMMEVFKKFNESHRERIVGLAETVGIVVEGLAGDSWLAAVDEETLTVRTPELCLRMAKDVALRISVLGMVPKQEEI
jgi:putative ribosome biogenesis GTPase RsgA